MDAYIQASVSSAAGCWRLPARPAALSSLADLSLLRRFICACDPSAEAETGTSSSPACSNLGRPDADRQSHSHRDFLRLREIHSPDHAAAHPDWPHGLHPVDFGALKQKLLGSIVGIAAVDALAWYFDLENIPTTSRLSGCWLSRDFAVVMLLLAAARLADRPPQERDPINAVFPASYPVPTPGPGEGLLTIPGR